MRKPDKYDLLLEDAEVFEEQLTELLDELGISPATGQPYDLILWNDSVNDMLHVVLALYEVCGLDNEESMKVMMEAHTKGKALVKSGSYKEMMELKLGLNDRGLEATVES